MDDAIATENPTECRNLAKLIAGCLTDNTSREDRRQINSACSILECAAKKFAKSTSVINLKDIQSFFPQFPYDDAKHSPTMEVDDVDDSEFLSLLIVID